MLYREQNAQRALSPTSITIADYVINPYVGCDFDCCYCYGRLNSTYQKKKEKFGGDFVEIKPNFIAVLTRELDEKKPSHVLIGSTTEAFQHIDAKYKYSRKILLLLNEKQISYTILTKSHRIQEHVDLIRCNPLNEVYFTINTLDDLVRQRFEPGASAIKERLVAIEILAGAGIRIILHVGPYFPGITNMETIGERLKHICSRIEVETLNLKMARRTTVLDTLKSFYPESYELITKIHATSDTYKTYYEKEEIHWQDIAKKTGFAMKCFIYPYNSFYNNMLNY